MGDEEVEAASRRDYFRLGRKIKETHRFPAPRESKSKENDSSSI